MPIREQAITEVIVDGEQAGQELQKLTKRADDLWQKLAEAKMSGDEGTFKKLQKEIKDVDKQMGSFKKVVFDVDKVLKDLSGSSINDLTKAKRNLTNEVSKLTRGTQEYINKSKQLNQVKAELAKIRNESNLVVRSIAGLDDAASVLPGVFGRAAGAASGLLSKVMALGPVGAAIGGGIALVSAPLFAFFKGTEQGVEFIERKVAGFKASVGVLKGELIDLGRKMVGDSGESAIKWGNIMGKGLKILASTANLIPGVSDYIDKLTQRMNDAAVAGEKIAKAYQDIEDEERALILPREQANTAIAKARLLYEDDTKSYTERIAALKQSLDLEDKVAADELALQKKRTVAVRQEIILQKDANKEVRDELDKKLQESLAKEEQLERESIQRKIRATRTLNTAKDELYKQDKLNLVKSLDVAHNEYIAKLKQQYIDQKLTKEQLDSELLQADIVYLTEKKALYQKTGQDISDIESQLQDKQMQLLDQKFKANKEKWDVYNKKNEEDNKSALDQFTEMQDEGLDLLSEQADAEIDIFKQKNEEIKKLREEDADNARKIAERQVDIAMQMGSDIGQIVADQINSGKISLENFGKAILLAGLKTMKGILAQAIFESTVKNLSTLGPVGLIKAGIEIGLMETAYRVMEAKLQMAKGRYPVMGPDDGRTYMSSFVGKPVTGIYEKPTVGLFSERMPEMVIDGPTTRNIQINRPDIINAIMSARVGQFASGRYPATDQAGGAPGSGPDLSGLVNSINRLNYLLDNGIAAKFSYDTVRDIRDRTGDITKIENRTRGA